MYTYIYIYIYRVIDLDRCRYIDHILLYYVKSAEALCLRRVEISLQTQSSNQIQSTVFFTKLNQTIKSNTQSQGRGYPSPTPTLDSPPY